MHWIWCQNGTDTIFCLKFVERLFVKYVQNSNFKCRFHFKSLQILQKIPPCVLSWIQDSTLCLLLNAVATLSYHRCQIPPSGVYWIPDWTLCLIMLIQDPRFHSLYYPGCQIPLSVLSWIQDSTFCLILDPRFHSVSSRMQIPLCLFLDIDATV